MQGELPDQIHTFENPLERSIKVEDIFEKAKALPKDERIKLTHLLIDLSATEESSAINRAWENKY